MIKHKDESIFIDFEYTDGEIPDGYYAKYYIEKLLNSEVIKEDYLDRDETNTKFLLRIESGDLNDLNLSKVKLKVAVINDDVKYKDYIFEDIVAFKED